MSAVEALCMAQENGIRLGIAGADLILDAKQEPAPAVLEALKRHKTEIVALLVADQDECSRKDWLAVFDERAAIAEHDGGQTRAAAEQMAFEHCVVEWLNRQPGSADRYACAGCGKPGSNDSVIVPIGTHPANQSWLHPGCWPQWHQDRLAAARQALMALGISEGSPS
jgi:hypothetical protein